MLSEVQKVSIKPKISSFKSNTLLFLICRLLKIAFLAFQPGTKAEFDNHLP